MAPADPVVARQPRVILDSYNLDAARRALVVDALDATGTIVGAAELLGITRSELKRIIIKLRIEWPRSQGAAR